MIFLMIWRSLPRRVRQVLSSLVLIYMALFVCSCAIQNKMAEKAEPAPKEEQSLSYLDPTQFEEEESTQKPEETATGEIDISFIDVGQGDSILIIDDGSVMLIDTGYYSEIDKLYEELGNRGVQKVDVLVCTHPDADHIGSAADIVSYYDVDTVYMPDVQKDSEAYGYLMNAIETFDIPVVHPYAGDLIPFGTGTYEVVGPVSGKYYDDVNSYSIMIRLTNGKDSFLFTGDATGEEVDDVLEAGIDVSATTYKVAHHGSFNEGCNNPNFVIAVHPRNAVISCGKDNEYGHPHEETMQLMSQIGVNLFRTDEQGTIRCKSLGDGHVQWDKEPATGYGSTQKQLLDAIK